MRGVTLNMVCVITDNFISTHTPHARRDTGEIGTNATLVKFLLTRLMRGVTPYSNRFKGMITFLLTRLMRGVTKRIFRNTAITSISTHTPHARRDFQASTPVLLYQNFYSHASCEA